MKISLILPTLNEAENLPRLLAEIPAGQVDEIIVVDGNSTDGTPELAAAAGARVVNEPRRGYGRACLSGALAATGEVLVFMDADGADDPSDLPHLLAPLRTGQADLALGSRLARPLARGAMPWHQQAGNRLAAWLFRRLYGLPLTDLSPLRAIRRADLLALELQELTYGWPTEMIARAARRGLRLTEIPVNYWPRRAGRSKISGTLRGTLGATYYILGTIWKYR